MGGEQEREVIFADWLAEVEALLDRHLDRDAAYKAWTDGYSAAEYAYENERESANVIEKDAAQSEGKRHYLSSAGRP